MVASISPYRYWLLKGKQKRSRYRTFQVTFHRPFHLLSELRSRAYIHLFDALNRMVPSVCNRTTGCGDINEIVVFFVKFTEHGMKSHHNSMSSCRIPKIFDISVALDLLCNSFHTSVSIQWLLPKALGS